VGKAVNQSLVISSIAVFFSDYIMAGIASITFEVAEKLLFFEGLQ